MVETGRLACCGDVNRRLLETGVFNIDVIEHGLHELTSPAFQSIAAVRMLHCMVRKHVSSHCPWWDSASLGVPVCQEDAIHTVYLNSSSALRGMEMLGVLITPYDRECVSMFWTYVGYLLGIQEEFLPHSYPEELHWMDVMRRHSFHPSRDSHTLVQATLRGVAGLPPYHFDYEQNAALVRSVMDYTLAEELCVPRTHRWKDWALLYYILITTRCQSVVEYYWGLDTTRWDVEWIRSNLESNLKAYNREGKATWRLLLANRKHGAAIQ